MEFQTKSLSEHIDHTLLRSDLQESDLKRHCEDAMRYRFKGVCIPREWVAYCSKALQGSAVLTITVVGFPSGLERTELKVQQAAQAIADGAQELDMVIQITALKEKDYARVFDDIHQVVAITKSKGSIPVPVKVILETGLLSNAEKQIGAALAKAAGATFVKTCTGFAAGQATVEDIQLLRSTVGDGFGIKASGGIRTRDAALQMIAAGATRLGTSASLQIVSTDLAHSNSGGGHY